MRSYKENTAIQKVVDKYIAKLNLKKNTTLQRDISCLGGWTGKELFEKFDHPFIHRTILQIQDVPLLQEQIMLFNMLQILFEKCLEKKNRKSASHAATFHNLINKPVASLIEFDQVIKYCFGLTFDDYIGDFVNSPYWKTLILQKYNNDTIS